MSQSPKQYPRNNVYNRANRTPFQQVSKNNESKNVINMVGTSLSELTHSTQSIKPNSQQIIVLNQKVQQLSQQLQMVTQLLMEEDTKRQVIEKMQKLEGENKGLMESLNKCQQMNVMLENQLVISEKSNKNLSSALQAASNELQIIKKQIESESKKELQLINESKTSLKSKEEVQQDIIRVNVEIESVLEKMQTLNSDYQSLREKNESLQKDRVEMNAKIVNLKEELAQTLKALEKQRADTEYSKEQIILLREEIQQVSDLSIKKQKQMQDQIYEREKELQQQLQNIKSMPREQQSNKISSQKQVQLKEESKFLEMKNMRIDALEKENQFLKEELQAKEHKLEQIQERGKFLQKKMEEMNHKLQELNDIYKDKIAILERNSESRVIQLQEQIREMKSNQWKITSLENDQKQYIAELKSKEERVFALEAEIRELKKRENMIAELEEEIKRLKSQQLQKEKQNREVERKKMEVTQQLDEVTSKLEKVKNQLRNANEIKEKYGNEIQSLKQRVKQLTRLSQDQSQHIKQIENEHEMRRKIENEVSIISASEFTHNQKTIDLEQTNKQLEKLLLNEKIDKENQNKKYKELLEDYKHLNEQMSTQLQMYRDAKSIDHPLCPTSLQQSRQQSVIVMKQMSFQQLQSEKQKFQKLMLKHEKSLQNYKGVQIKLNHLGKIQKEAQFLQIENSSMRSQITQLNIRIEEYKTTIENMSREADHRTYDIDQLKYSIQREYEAKIQLQKNQIINQYNILLRSRGVRIQPTEFKHFWQRNISELSQQNYEQPFERHPQYWKSNFIFTADQKIKYHPDYKKLQQEYLKMHRYLLETEQFFNKARTSYKDQIQKLKIQNQYHRKTIDELHAEGYGLHDEEDAHRYFKYKQQQRGGNYQKLHEEYITLKNKNAQDNSFYSNNRQGQKIRDIFQKSAYNVERQGSLVQKSQLERLKRTMDEKLIQLQITPREPVSIIERASWMMEKMGALIEQLRQDRETLRNQKKEVGKENDKLKVRIEALEYENSQLLKELKVTIEKFKCLEDKNFKIVNIPFSEKFEFSQKTSHPMLETEFPKQKDVYLYEANKIREERLALLRKYNEQLQSLELQQI